MRAPPWGTPAPPCWHSWIAGDTCRPATTAEAGSYFGYVLSDGTVAPCLFTQRQVEQGNGRKHGFLRAFHEAASPTGPGCSCVPTYEVNRMLAFDPNVLWNASAPPCGARRGKQVAPEKMPRNAATANAAECRNF